MNRVGKVNKSSTILKKNTPIYIKPHVVQSVPISLSALFDSPSGVGVEDGEEGGGFHGQLHNKPGL